MSTKMFKKRPSATSEMLSQTLISARSHPSFQNVKITTQTQNQKSEKQKLVFTFEDKIFTNEKFGSEKQYHSKTEPCPILFHQTDSQSNKRMFDKITPQPNPKTGQNKEAKKSNFTSSNKKMLTDSVNSNLPHPEHVHITTRGAISSNMGKIFDPIGLTPVRLQCKILFQMTWEHEIGWDDDVASTITDQFKAWMIGLNHLSELRIPRFLAAFAFEKIHLHLFCDASEKAYGAAICPITGSIWDQVYLPMFQVQIGA